MLTIWYEILQYIFIYLSSINSNCKFKVPSNLSTNAFSFFVWPNNIFLAVNPDHRYPLRRPIFITSVSWLALQTCLTQLVCEVNYIRNPANCFVNANVWNSNIKSNKPWFISNIEQPGSKVSTNFTLFIPFHENVGDVDTAALQNRWIHHLILGRYYFFNTKLLFPPCSRIPQCQSWWWRWRWGREWQSASPPVWQTLLQHPSPARLF